MIGIVVPVHNEQALLAQCLTALCVAAEHCRQIRQEAVAIAVVLDACTDASEAIARRFAVDVLPVEYTNVGQARHAGASHLLERGARWLAFTDADSTVERDWLSTQCAQPGDAVCGGIRLDGWRQLSMEQRRRYLAHLQGSGSQRIYGANLGVCARAYRAVGGFEPRRCHEDVHLVRALQAGGFRIVWDSSSQVVTSARHEARAPEGLGALLGTLLTPSP